MINWELIDGVVSEEQSKILKMLLENKESLRTISVRLGIGRTKLKNIVESCKGLTEELDTEIDLRLLNSKTHKNAENISDINLAPLTEEQIQSAYIEIMQGGSTLTDVAGILNKQRDTVKKAILDYLEGDTAAIKEFKSTLTDNQRGVKEARYFSSRSPEEKKQMIFEKLNTRTKLSKRTPYSIQSLEKRFIRLKEFFEKRNGRIENPIDRISEEDLLKMLYDFPEMLPMSLTGKIRPTIGKMDEKYLGEANTTRVLKENPAIVGTTAVRIRLQCRILKDTSTLKYALEKPRIFRTSPELLYAEIKNWQDRGEKSNTPFMSRARLKEIYGKEPEEMMKKYNIVDEYGDDEYFDGR